MSLPDSSKLSLPIERKFGPTPFDQAHDLAANFGGATNALMAMLENRDIYPDHDTMLVLLSMAIAEMRTGG